MTAASTIVTTAITTVPSSFAPLGAGGRRADAGGAEAVGATEMGFGGGANETEGVA
jgi:hypothetical protein